MTYLENVQRMFYSDRIGKVYGCFEVIDIKFDKEIHKQVWTMRCVHCGKIKVTHNGKEFVKGKNKGTCKCQFVPKISEKKKKEPKPRKPAMKDHELYGRWEKIKKRCYSENCKAYKDYGARGIKMCDEWKNNFWAFAGWAETHGYRKELTIERVDNDGNYCPENCTWIERRFQNKNKRNVKLYDGLTLPDYCDEHGIPYAPILKRMEQGMNLEEAIADQKDFEVRKEFNRKCRAMGIGPETVRKRMADGETFEQATDKNRGKYCIDGEYGSIYELAEKYGITVNAVKYRMNVVGMSLEEALKTPKQQGNEIIR